MEKKKLFYASISTRMLTAAFFQPFSREVIYVLDVGTCKIGNWTRGGGGGGVAFIQVEFSVLSFAENILEAHSGLAGIDWLFTQCS